MTAKTPTERVSKLRADRKAQDLRRFEIYAHLDDWPEIKTLADKLQQKRKLDKNPLRVK